MEAPIDAAAAAGEEVGPLESIGAYLARHRRLRGISAEELAEVTRIPLRSIERLESGVFDNNIDGFVRGFVRTVSEALGLDADHTVARMLSEPGTEMGRTGPPRALQQPVLALAAVAVLAIAILAVAVQVLRGLWQTTPEFDEQWVRRDPVRALAEAQGYDTSADGARFPAARSVESAPTGDVSAPPPEPEAPSKAATSIGARSR